MKVSRKTIQSKTSAIPDIQFQDQNLTSFAGATLFQLLFQRLQLKQRVSHCFRHLSNSVSYDCGLVTVILIVHLMLGYRKLQDIRFYQYDPVILRLLGLNRLPHDSTLSRQLSKMDKQSVTQMRRFCRDLVLDRLSMECLNRITLDLDGSVQPTSRFAEGSAVGFNKKKKGQRSYYPLFATIAQTGEVFDVWHRPGNVHDSNGAQAFILDCIDSIRSTLPGVIIEVRMDSAFFNEDLIDALQQVGVEFTISVPFARFTELKSKIENRKRWRTMNHSMSYFESDWKPKCWGDAYRFLFIRKRNRIQMKGPVQLDLFTPYDHQHDFKAIVTNKRMKAKKILTYHNGRGQQENLFSEIKSQTQMEYVPTKRLVGNQIYLLATLIAHNLNREIQMISSQRVRNTTEKRAPLWVFDKIDSLRRKVIQRAGRITKPNGKLTLTMNANPAFQEEFIHYMDALAA